MTTQHPSTGLSESELLLELGCAPSTSNRAETNKAATIANKKGSFLTKQYPIFSTSHFIIYLQGVLPAVANATNPDELIAEAFKCANSRILGRKDFPPLLKIDINKIIEHKSKLYTDKAFHTSILQTLLERGLVLDKAKVANRAAVLSTIDTYLADLVNFLLSENFNSPEEYLASKSNKGNIGPALTASDLASLWDEL